MAATTEKFAQSLRESGLIDPVRLDCYLKFHAVQAKDDPAILARQMVADRLLTEFQSEQLLKGRSKGFILRKKYKVLKLLGAGGMGRVYLAEHMLLKRQVAIKLLAPAHVQNPAFLERFQREARAVAALDDPHIVRIFDVEDDSENPLMVMEFVDGVSLHDIVADSGVLTLGQAADYVTQAASGLTHAMEHGIVHRDIKPANLLLDRSGVLKVADMGIAKFRHGGSTGSSLSSGELILGTVDFLAPEQAADYSHVDVRADIYGLGGTLYYLLVGEVPFPEGTQEEKLLAHQRTPVPSVRRRRAEIPAEIDEIVSKMMAKQAKDRFQTPQEVTEALAPWTSDPIGPPDFAWYARNPPIQIRTMDPDASTDEIPVLPPLHPRKAATKAAGLDRGQLLKMLRQPGFIALFVFAVLFLIGLGYVIAKLREPVPLEG